MSGIRGIDPARRGSGIWIVAVDWNEEFVEFSLPQICEARKLSNRLGPVIAVLAGPDGQQARLAGCQGADVAMTLSPVSAPSLPAAAAVAARIVELFQEQTPRLMLFASTRRGDEVAGLVAARLALPVIRHAVGLQVGSQDQFVIAKPEHGGKVIRTLETVPGCSLVLTSTPGAFVLERPDAARKITVTDVPWGASASELDTIRVLEVMDEEPSKQDLSEAKVVIGCGRGLAGPGNLPLLEELATLLGGTLGCTRVAVDAGWLPFAKQIGQTGKSIAPRLYIACGISGASHHVAGVQGARLIVAINQDPNAPIFEMADFAVVGDLFEVIPELITEIQRRKSITPPQKAVGGS